MIKYLLALVGIILLFVFPPAGIAVLIIAFLAFLISR